MSWNITKNFSLAGGVWNILDDHHSEAIDGFASPNTSEVPRTFFAEVQARF